MKIIPPIAVNADNLTASNVAITETEWAAGTYDTGVQRRVGIDLYEVVATPSTADEPVAGSQLDPPTWIRLGRINRYRMFDLIIGEGSEVASGNIDATVTPAQVVNSVAFFEVSADSVQVIVTDPVDGEVYNKTKMLNDNTGVNNWYNWFFAPIRKSDSALFADLPAYGGAAVRVIAAVSTGGARIGECILGRSVTLGVTLIDHSIGIEDFSRKERDAFGRFVIVERRFARLLTFGVFLDNAQFNSTFRQLAEVRATPVVYIGNDDKPETIAIGFYRDFSILRTGPVSSEMLIEIEGLI